MLPTLSRPAPHWLATLLAGAVWLAAGSAPASGSRVLPKRFTRSPYSLMSLSVGHPNNGWQVRARRLREKTYLHIKQGSRPNSYGHPALVLMLERSAHEVARAAPGAVMLVGDLSREPGGPLPGHRSHQSGRDADVAFYVRDAKGRPAKLTHFVTFDGNGRATDGSGLVFDDERNWLLVQAWLTDHRAGILHVFISTPLRARLLAYAAAHDALRAYVNEAAALLHQPEDSTPHDDHFHVRIACPRDQDEICQAESM